MQYAGCIPSRLPCFLFTYANSLFINLRYFFKKTDWQITTATVLSTCAEIITIPADYSQYDDTTAIGKLRINAPEASGKKIKGIKATIKVAVQPTTAKVICFVAIMEASRLL